MKRTNSFASNKFYFRFIRNAFLTVSLVLFLVAGLGVIFPDLVIINGESISIDGLITICCLGFLSLVLFILSRNKFAYAIIDSSSITIISPKKRGKFSWPEVTVRQVQFIFPPLYKITTPDQKTFFFNTENKYILFSFGVVIDISQMGELIKKKRIG